MRGLVRNIDPGIKDELFNLMFALRGWPVQVDEKTLMPNIPRSVLITPPGSEEEPKR